MKKLTAILLTLCSTLAFNACSGKPKSKAIDKPVAPPPAAANVKNFRVHTEFGKKIQVAAYRHGTAEIKLAKSEVGQEAATDDTKDESKTHPLPYQFKWLVKTLEPLVVRVGEAFETDPHTIAHLEMLDGTHVYVGKDTLIEFRTYEGLGSARKVNLRLLKGSLLVRIHDPVDASMQFVIETPNAIASDRGKFYRTKDHATEFFISTEFNIENISRTDIKVLHGQVSADILKIASSKKVYSVPVVVNPASHWRVDGRQGLGQIQRTSSFTKSDYDSSLVRSGFDQI